MWHLFMRISCTNRSTALNVHCMSSMWQLLITCPALTTVHVWACKYEVCAVCPRIMIGPIPPYVGVCGTAARSIELIATNACVSAAINSSTFCCTGVASNKLSPREDHNNLASTVWYLELDVVTRRRYLVEDQRWFHDNDIVVRPVDRCQNRVLLLFRN